MYFLQVEFKDIFQFSQAKHQIYFNSSRIHFHSTLPFKNVSDPEYISPSDSPANVILWRQQPPGRFDRTELDGGGDLGDCGIEGIASGLLQESSGQTYTMNNNFENWKFSLESKII